jgi:hypothetical protein
MAREETGQGTAAPWDSSLTKRRNNLCQREVRLRADKREDLAGIFLQWRRASAARHGFASPVIAKAVHPANGRTGADLKLFGRSASGPSSFHEGNHAHSQLTRIRSMHGPALRRINALDSLSKGVLGITDSLRPGRAVVS